MGTLLEAIGIVLETHFGFGFPNGSPIGDSLVRKNFQDSPSHRIFGRMHEALNICENKN